MKIFALVVLLLAAAELRLTAQTPIDLQYIGTFPTDGTVLGAISDVDVLLDGSLLVLDAQANQLFVFSESGELTRTIGREGAGPGEMRGATEVEVTPEGVIVLLDPLNIRFTTWTSTGELIGSQRIDRILRLGLEWPHEFYWSEVGPIVKTSFFDPEGPLAFLSLESDLSEIKDTLAFVADSGDGATGRFTPFAVSLEGEVLAAKGDTVYSISILTREGGVTRSFSRWDLPAQPMTESDLAQLQRNLDRLPIPPGTELPPMDLPEFHRRFSSRSIDVDHLGRLWTCPSTSAASPSTFDVFSPSGDFVGSGSVPEHVSGMRIIGSRLLAIGETSIGEPVVRVYEIH